MTSDKRDSPLREVLEWVTRYGEINIEICGDNIILDPVLRGQGFSPENVAISEKCQTMSTIHSAKYHACQEIASQIEAMLEGRDHA